MNLQIAIKMEEGELERNVIIISLVFPVVCEFPFRKIFRIYGNAKPSINMKT